MLTLGIETSCDETSCSVLRDKDELLSNIVSSSLFRHKPFGGVVPEIASRHALEQIDTVLSEALSEAKVTLNDIDLIAVTHGPGLIGSLFVGVSFAKALAFQLNKPLIGVNHLEAHLAANFIGHEEPAAYVGLLVSGGHTCLTYHTISNAQSAERRAQSGKEVNSDSERYAPCAMPHASDMKLLGETVDDAAGEAFDKVAKLLGLGYPGGPMIEKMAREGDPKKYSFTLPKQSQRFGFSFSGIKTAVRLLVEKEQSAERKAQSENERQHDSERHAPCAMPLADSFVTDVAASFQRCVVSWLVAKTLDAAESKGVHHVIIGGGVSANQYLCQELRAAASAKGIEVILPGKGLSIDNAGMIARRGWDLYQKGMRSSLTLTATPNLALA